MLTSKRCWRAALVVSVFLISVATILQSLQFSDADAALDMDALSALPSVPMKEVLNKGNVSSMEKLLVNNPGSGPGNYGVETHIDPGKVSGITREYSPKGSHLSLSPSNSTGRIFGNFSNNLARGANIMTSISGCHIAAWIYYQSPDRTTPDCSGGRTSKQQLWSHEGDTGPLPDDLQAFDTVYVHKRMVETFVQNTLPHLDTPIILLTGSYENAKHFRVAKDIAQRLLENPMVVHWFCTNIYETLGFESLPPKLHPMALGVEPFGKDPKRDPIPVAVIRDTILRYASEKDWGALPNKTIGIFDAYTSPIRNQKSQNLSLGIRLPLPDYLEHMARSKFVTSRGPDCYQPYEALGFGAIPITELDPNLHSHLKAGPVIFHNHQLRNITEMRALQLHSLTEHPIVNRNLIFEEYWMEEMETIVSRPLRWYDLRQNKRCKLIDFELDFDEVPLLMKAAWADYSANSTEMLQNYIGERKLRQKKWALHVLKDLSTNGSPASMNRPRVSSLLGARRFNNFTTNLARGANLMTSISGCHVASWIYMVGKQKQNPDCGGARSKPTQLLNFEMGQVQQIEADDTIYVHLRLVKDFVDNFLPLLTVPIVLLTGSYDNTRNNRIPYGAVEMLIESPQIEHWFCQNVENSTGLRFLPPKVHSMALGIEPFGKNPGAHPNPVVIIRDAFLRYAFDLPNKTIGVFEAYTSPHTNPNRKNMPRGMKMLLPDYLEQLAKSKFVLSPNGHKPDCFRHYEALAFGAIPVTELDPSFYSHLEAGPVVYSNTEWWNLTEEELFQRLNVTEFPSVNRNLIFEEYWMEDMERIVGRQLRWFDVRRQERSLLIDFYVNFDEVQQIIDSAWNDFSNNSAVMMQRFVGETKAWRKKNWPPAHFPATK